ncbi:hypothetical protein QTP86_026111 [Hemibagrus guttatus]|nr:hypothetical protein QTP86_026111 [Hemibagrus guttatus]
MQGMRRTRVRLVGGSRCSGRVEVLHEKTWSSVCDDDFDNQDAEVVCRDLGCGPFVKMLGAAAFGRGKSQVWGKELQCKGTESQIQFCPTREHNCSHYSDVGLVCAGKCCNLHLLSLIFLSYLRIFFPYLSKILLHVMSLHHSCLLMSILSCTDNVRLVDGGSRCAGRVEVLHREKWGTVCNDNWNIKAAAVVCRELGCGEAIDALHHSHFGSGSGFIWMDDVSCTGSESTLKNCGSVEFGKHNCDHDKDAGVICSGAVKLVDGGSQCAGRVEVFYRGQWGTVCNDYFNKKVATVVCKELGCSDVIEIPGKAHFGQGSGPVWMVVEECRVRLVGGSHCSGRVEILHEKTWATVCGAAFRQQDAEVVCRELGCGSPEEVLGADAFGSGEGLVWEKEFQCSGTESQIHFCPTSLLKHNCSHSSDVGLVCAGHREPRLIDGPHLCSGRVEVFTGNTWATVYDAEFDQQDAEIVCRELGCGLPVQVVRASAFGKGKSQVWIKELQCRGNESQIYFCQGSFTLEHNCSHENDVGLICSALSVCPGHTDARLVNSMDSCSGRVELKYLDTWGTICAVNWNMRAANVLCEQLNCGSAVAVVEADWFEAGIGQIWADIFECQGNETHLSQCPISSWSRAACSHKQDAGVICNGVFNRTYSSIRLVDSGGDDCAGRLEVLHNGSWGTVRHDLWDIKDAQVVCRQLQCGVALRDHVLSWFGPGTGPIWLNQVECTGKEEALWDCQFQFSEEKESGHQEDVGIVCSVQKVNLLPAEFKEIRLTEGCKGNLEVFYNGTWGNVCENGIDEETASLICRELNCGTTGTEYWSNARLKFAPNWLDDLKCRKHDATLWHCQSSPWRNNKCNRVAHITCTGCVKMADVFSCGMCAICVEHLPLRLSGGEGDCSGRLELYYNATWGTICSDQWDIKDAQVVCRQLGCGQALRADRNALFGAGEGVIWLNRVNCRGNEIHVWDCLFSLKNHTDCFHRQDAGVTCAGL